MKVVETRIALRFGEPSHWPGTLLPGPERRVRLEFCGSSRQRQAQNLESLIRLTNQRAASGSGVNFTDVVIDRIEVDVARIEPKSRSRNRPSLRVSFRQHAVEGRANAQSRPLDSSFPGGDCLMSHIPATVAQMTAPVDSGLGYMSRPAGFISIVNRYRLDQKNSRAAPEMRPAFCGR